MMREILFRGKAANRNPHRQYRTKYKNGDWVFGMLTDPMNYAGFAEMTNTNGVSGIEVDKNTVGQFTGLYDSTKWKDLTDAEKLDFYHKHYVGEDGMSVRFQNIDDVKHLWKGKKIFEGDIVRYTERRFGGEDVPVVNVVEFAEGGFAVRNYFLNHWLRDGLNGNIQMEGIEVIGNIHDNPELLEGA